MSTQHPPPLPSAPGQGGSGPKLSRLFLGVAAGAILALVFVTVVLVAVLWKGGFFNSRNPSVAREERLERVAPAPRVEPATRVEPAPRLVRPANNHPPLTAAPAAVAVAAGPESIAPVFHIRSKTSNLLDDQPVTIESGGEVRRGEGYLVVSDSEKLRITGPFTVSAWFQPRTMDRGMTIASRALNGPPWSYPFSSWLLRVNSPKHLEGSLSDGRGYFPSTWSVSLEPGQWYHAVLTYDGIIKRMFLNGVMQPTLASGTIENRTGIGNAAGHSILIGADESESPAAEIFDGAIDDVRVFNRGLPEDEVQSLFSEGAKRYGLNP
jgi:hypothetical protein